MNFKFYSFRCMFEKKFLPKNCQFEKPKINIGSKLFFSLSSLLLITSSSLYAAEAPQVDFSPEELATETVLPVFDKRVVVRERYVNTEGRLEVGLGGGLNLVEPLYQQTTFNFTASYHFTELHGLEINGFFLNTGLSDAASDLKAGKGLKTGSFDASLAPTVESMYFANYQLTAYYGKVSLSKQSTLNLSLYGLLGAGLVNWSDSSQFGLDVGLGQKVYFTPNFGLRIDLIMALYQGPDPTSPTGSNSMVAGGPKLTSNDFEQTYYMHPFLTAGLVLLF